MLAERVVERPLPLTTKSIVNKDKRKADIHSAFMRYNSAQNSDFLMARGGVAFRVQSEESERGTSATRTRRFQD